ncbi:MAG: alpha/beta hydrolase [Nocardioidaceae bacterium]|nr:alpha/beta hydrolase [Nocardioidaceae bacterium]
MRRRLGSVLALAVTGAVLLAGCTQAGDLASRSGPTGGTDGPQASSAPDADLASFYGQELTWEECGVAQCAGVEVPIDYADPTGETVELRLRKEPAQGERKGTVFINPGGPGGSGQEFVSSFEGAAPSGVLDAYDVVGFDPRGVGESTPLECLDDEQLDAYVASDPAPDTPVEVAAFAADSKQMGDACLANSGELARHVSTVEVAKDLDVLRALVGDDTLTYYGASYGTSIGATYAELFPKRVGRMILDGAIDPQLDARETNLGQAKGFQTALSAYIQDCVSGDSCPIGTDEADATAKLKAFLDGLDAQPLPTGDPDRPLGQTLGFYAVALPLYNQQSWPVLTQVLQAAYQGNGAPALSIADQYLGRTSDGYQDNSAQVIYAVNCLDDPETITPAETEQTIAQYEQVSPVFGEIFAWSPYGCATWPIKPTAEPLEIDGDGAAPIVVVGTTRDPATPYEWSQGMAEALESGVLVTRDGDGHTAFGVGNQCVDDMTEAYLVDGTVPDDGLTC